MALRDSVTESLREFAFSFRLWLKLIKTVMNSKKKTNKKNTSGLTEISMCESNTVCSLWQPIDQRFSR